MTSDTTVTADTATETILRFRRSERELHWAIALPFMVCYATATILVLVYNVDPSRPFRAVFSWTHRVSGVCLAICPALAILHHWRDFRLHLQNVIRAWAWSWDDVKWLALIGPASFTARVTLPHQGKFNAGEKINFVALNCTYPVYVVTGVIMLLPGTVFMSWLVHVCTAILVATPLFLGHVFMAVVNPDTRTGLPGMISGFVDRHWAHHHYHHWYEEMYGAGPAEAALASIGAGELPDLAAEVEQAPGGPSTDHGARLRLPDGPKCALPVAAPARSPHLDARRVEGPWVDLTAAAEAGK